MKIQTITIKEYLDQKGIVYRESNGELITGCLFNNCDADSRPNEAHLYFNAETGQYDCKKCGERGNIFNLAKLLGDDTKDIIIPNTKNAPTPKKPIVFDISIVEKCYQQLLENIRKWLNDRGITDDLIDLYKLGYGKFYGHYWITIPVKDKSGKYTFLKLRRDPEDNHNPDKYKFYPKGSIASLFGINTIKNTDESLIICEGEFDQMVLKSKGVQSVSSTAGAKTFKKEWLNDLLNIKKFYVGYDNDEEGETGTVDVISKIREKFPLVEIYKINLSKKVGHKEDVSDYFVKYGGSVEEYFSLAQKVESVSDLKLRIVSVPKPEQEISFEKWKQIIQDNFPELAFTAELAMSVLVQILITDITNPFALILIDTPSAGKTIEINFFADILGLTYETDKFSPASFVSNAANVPKEKLAEIDLLPRIRYKMFLIRDFATLFSKREEDLTELLGTLTRVLDGEGLITDTGVHGNRQYKGEYLFMMLAASTPIPPRVWKVMGNLGSRLFFVNINSKEKSEEELSDQLSNVSYKERERICRNATKNFAYTLWNLYKNGISWDKSLDSKEVKLIIARCAKLLAKLRGVINVWYSEEVGSYSYTAPLIEKPDRINQLLYNLTRGHAVIQGRKSINFDDLSSVVELTLDSAPSIRSQVFKMLLEHNGQLKTGEVEIALRCSKPTALKEMETLRILGLGYIIDDSSGSIGQPEKILRLNSEFEWFLSNECKRIRGIPLPPEQSTMSF